MDYSSYDDIFSQVGQKYGIDPALLKAQAMAESSLDSNAVGPVTPQGQAHGISQIMPATAKSMGVDPTDPQASIDAQARILKDNLAQFGTPENAVLAYHGGTNQANWGLKTQAYLQKVSTNYQQLKAASNGNQPTQQSLVPQDDFEKEVLGGSATPATAQLTPQDDFEKEVLAASAPVKAQPISQAAAAVAPIAENKTSPNENLSVSALSKLQQDDPTAYKNYMDQKAAQARGEFSYGLGDVPRSIAKTTAAIAPGAFNAIATAAVPAYATLTGQPVPSSQELAEANAQTPPTQAFQNALQQRNEEYQEQYGNDPHQAGNRLLGEVVGSGPALGAVSKGAGAVLQGAKTVLPAAAGPALDFLGGKVASNAVVDPATGAVTQGATLGNRLLQYGASGLHSAALAAPVTALTDAGSDTSAGKQFEQNSIVGGVLGAAAPAAFDLGGAAIDKGRQLLSGVDAATQKAQGAVQKLAGGLPQQLDTTEYVPGSTPSMAKAAAYAGDPKAGDIAALEKTLSESKVGSEKLYSPEFRQQETANDQARRQFTLSMTGTPADITQLQQARSASANALMGNEAKRLVDPTLPKGTVWQNAKEADVSKALDFIDAAQAPGSPISGNAGLQKRLDSMRELLTSSQGKDPQYIYESVIKPHITDVLDSTNPFDANNATKSQLPYLKVMKGLLDDAVGDAAPGYKSYLSDYTARSKAIERMQGLQSLGLVNPEADTSVPTLSRVNNALKKVQEGRVNYDPTDPMKSLLPADVNKLQNLQKDLEREGSADRLIATKGSPTTPKAQFVEKTKNALGMGEPTIMGRVVNPTTIGGATGAGAGAWAATHLGAPPWVGAEIGGAAGAGIGKAITIPRQRAAEAAQNKLVEMLLNPKTAAAAPSMSLTPQIGQFPGLQNALSSSAPLAVQENRLSGR